jgi:hypothetical protein
MKPSMKVLPGGADTANSAVTKLNVTQYAAGAQYFPGQPAPIPVIISRVRSQFPLPSCTTVLQPRIPFVPLSGAPTLPSPTRLPVLPVRIGFPQLPLPPPPPIWNKPIRCGPYTMTPSNGIMSWSPAAATKVVTVSPQSMLRSSASMGLPGVMPLTPRRSLYYEPRKGAFTTDLSAPSVVQPLMAVTGKMPTLDTGRANARDDIDWDGWYKRVSNAIYQVWAKTDPYPGEAKVAVTIFKGGAIDCCITSFTPAADLERDAAKEAAFRQGAINSIYALKKCEILQFPYQSKKDKVSFEVDMQESVNGRAGCSIAPIRETEKSSDSAPN